MSDSPGERNLPATPRRRAEAIERGGLPKSGPLTAAALMLVVSAYAATSGSDAVIRAAHWLRYRLTAIDVTASAPLELLQVTRESLWAGIALAGGLVLLALTSVIFVELLQSGLRVHPQRAAPDMNRLLGAGSERIAAGLSPVRLLTEAMRWMTPMALCGLLLVSRWSDLTGLMAESPLETPQVAGELLASLAVRVGMTVLLLGALHYGWSRWSWERSLMMTADEQREEQRQERRRK